MVFSRIAEVTAGVIIALWGVLLLVAAYLQPYGDSRYAQPITLHPGFTSNEVPYILGIGLLFILAAGGAIYDGMRRSLIAVVLLGFSLVVFGALTYLALPSIGLAFLPVEAIGLTALVMARLQHSLTRTHAGNPRRSRHTSL